MLQRVATGAIDMDAAVGPAVGCMMATVGTALISGCIFEYKDPEAVSQHKAEERVELWGLQVGCRGMPNGKSHVTEWRRCLVTCELGGWALVIIMGTAPNF